MDNERNIEDAADRIVRWAARHPLSPEEAESRYAHLLQGLEPIAGPQRGHWSLFNLGSLALRYWRDRVQDFSGSLSAGGLVPVAAMRGGAAAPTAQPPERTLKADGQSGTACAKITGNADQTTVDLVLWLEPKVPGGDQPFTVTVLDPAKATIGGPIPCAMGNLIRFNAIAAAQEYTLIFEAAGERWEIRWGFSSASREPSIQ